MDLSALLRLLAFVAFVIAALFAFSVITSASQWADPTGWLATGLGLWVASTFTVTGRRIG